MTWQIGGNLQLGYTPPTSPNIGGDVAPPDNLLYPSGWFSAAFGLAAVVNFDQDISAAGWLSSTFGTGVIYAPPTLSPSGWVSGGVGTPAIENRTKLVLPGGIAPPPQTGPNGNREVPSPIIDLWRKFLTPTAVAPPAIATTHAVTHWIQSADLAGRSILPPAIAAPRIEFRNRTIAPPFIVSTTFGGANVAFVQYPAPTGWSSSVVSDGADLQINLQRLFPDSGATDPAGYGQPTIRNQREFVRPTGWADAEVNFPVVWNRTQVIHVLPYMGTNDPATVWPEYAPFVINRNRELQAFGWVSSRFSFTSHDIRNTADPVLPPGLDATLWGSGTFIAYRDREVAPQGWSSSYSTEYTAVYTNTQWLYPRGWDSAAYGDFGSVVNTAQRVRHIDPYQGPLVGAHTVAFSVRTIFPFPMSPSLLGRSGEPEVRYNPFPILPQSIHDPRQFGGAFVEERFTIVRPSSANVFQSPRVGEPVVANRNRAVRPPPILSEEFGRATAFNQVQTLNIGMGQSSRFGTLSSIQYRTRALPIVGFLSSTIPHLHRIRNDIPDPPARQLLLPGGFVSSTHGVASLNQRSIAPLGFALTAFGQTRVAVNALLPTSIIDLDQVGHPWVRGTQFVYLEDYGIEPVSDRDATVSRQRLSPHTIYAPSSDQATGQTKLNHPGPTPEIINDELFRAPNLQLPPPTVLNRNRTIGPVPTHSQNSSSIVGALTIQLARRFVRPPSIRAFRAGLPVFLNTPQTVSLLDNHGIAPQTIPTHTVGFPPARPMPAPAGFVATLWGNTSVELFTREIAPQGVPHRGNPQQNLTSPWGTPMVGTTRWFDFQGFDAAIYGDARVEFRIRHLPVQGWDSFAQALRELAPRPADRMRVTRVGQSGRTNIIFFVSSIYRDTPTGIAPAEIFGTAAVTHRIQPVGARGFRREVFGRAIIQTTP